MSFKSKLVSVGTGDTDVFVMGATLQGAIVLEIGNVNASARTITLKFYDAVLNATTTLVSGYSIAANDVKKWPAPILMAAGDKIIMSASNGSSIVAHASVTDSESAPAAIGITPRGAWDNAVTYNTNDLVRVENAISAGRGATYLARPNASANLNKDPTTQTAFWMVYLVDGPTNDISTVTGSFAIQSDISPAQITSNQNDYAPTGYATAVVYRLDLDAARAITGLAGGADGVLKIIHNISAFSLTLTDASASSTAGNRFDFGSDLVIRAKCVAVLIYDSTASRWKLAAQGDAKAAKLNLVQTWTAKQIIASTFKLQETIEKAAIWVSGAPGSTQNFDVFSGAVQYFTGNNANNWTLNVRADGSNSLDSLMAIGDAITIAQIVTNGSTAYRLTALTVDGNAQSATWLGAAAPSAGTANKLDVYTITLIKTASATFVAFASFAGGN